MTAEMIIYSLAIFTILDVVFKTIPDWIQNRKLDKIYNLLKDMFDDTDDDDSNDMTM